MVFLRSCSKRRVGSCVCCATFSDYQLSRDRTPRLIQAQKWWKMDVRESSRCLRGFGTMSFDLESLVPVNQRTRADTNEDKFTIRLDPS